MTELIDRQAALKKMCETCGYCERFEKAMRTTHPDFVTDKCNNYKFLAEQPAVEAESVRHGRWVETEPDEDDRKIGIEFSIKCSKCHNENSHLDFNEVHEITGKTFWKSRFCPNCGARMDATDTNVGGKGGDGNET